MKEEQVGIESNFIDSSIILSYFFDEKFKELIEGESHISMSTVALFEVKKKMLDKNIPEKDINEKLNYLKSKIILVSLNEEMAEKAADISKKHNLPAADSLIYSTALISNIMLLTRDNDFRGLPNVKVL